MLLGFWLVYKVCSLVLLSRKFGVAKLKIRRSKSITTKSFPKLVFFEARSVEHVLRQAGAMQVCGPPPRLFKKNMALTRWLFVRLVVAYRIASGFWGACEPLWPIWKKLDERGCAQKLAKLFWTLITSSCKSMNFGQRNYDRLWSKDACFDRIWRCSEPDFKLVRGALLRREGFLECQVLEILPVRFSAKL